LGLKLGNGLLTIAGNNVLLILFFTMVTSLVLGMGVPTTANYLITSTIAAPIVMQLMLPGTDILVPALAAHLFAFYFGILADITPPVALAAYAGSAIAKGNPFKTGVQATKLVIGAFLIPYIFVMNPALILINTTWYQVLQIICTSLIGMISISAGTTGWLLGAANKVERVVMFVGGFMLIMPDILTDFLGIGLFLLMFMLQYKRYGWKRFAAKAQN